VRAAARTLIATEGFAHAAGSRRYRLTGAGEFDALFRRARRKDGRYVQLLWSPAARSPGRVGFAIGTKSLPRAVDRNRIRRMLREVLRIARPAIESSRDPSMTRRAA
jgi:ribonuclease P protein component